MIKSNIFHLKLALIAIVCGAILACIYTFISSMFQKTKIRNLVKIILDSALCIMIAICSVYISSNIGHTYIRLYIPLCLILGVLICNQTICKLLVKILNLVYNVIIKYLGRVFRLPLFRHLTKWGDRW